MPIVASVLRLARRFCNPGRSGSDLFGGLSINFSDLIVRTLPLKSDSFHEPNGLAFFR